MNKSASVCTLVSWKSGQCELLSVDVLMSEFIYQISYSAKLRAGQLPSLTLPSFSGTKGSGNKGTLEGGVLKVQTLEFPSGERFHHVVAAFSRQLGRKTACSWWSSSVSPSLGNVF